MVSYPSACLKVLRDNGTGPLKRAEWLSMYVFARFPRPRPSDGTSRAPAPRRESAADVPLEPFDEAAALRDLTHQGFAHRLRLSTGSLASIRGLALERETRGVLHPLAPSYEDAVDPLVACYEDTATWAPVEAIAMNLHPLVRQAVGRGSALLGSRVWWSFPREGSAPEEIQTGRRFHFDLYAWRSLSAFFYLTDVDEDAGPKCACSAATAARPCVTGSPRAAGARTRRSRASTVA